MNLKEIKQAVDDGKIVHWANDGYLVSKNDIGVYYITFTDNNDSIGLTWLDDKTLNGDEKDFYIKVSNIVKVPANEITCEGCYYKMNEVDCGYYKQHFNHPTCVLENIIYKLETPV